MDDRRVENQSMATAAALGAVAFWGLVPTSTRYLVEDLTPGNILICRFLFGGIFSILILLIVRPQLPKRKDLPIALALGLAGSLSFNIPTAYGIELVEGGVAAMLMGVQPVCIAVLSWVLLTEQISRRVVIGLAMAMLGVMCIAIGGGGGFNLSPSYLFGCFLVLLGSVLYATYTVLAKPHLERGIPGPSTAMIGTTLSIPVALPFGWSGFTEGVQNFDTTAWAAALLLALGASVLAPSLFNLSLSLGKASRAGLMLNLVPVVGVVSSVALLGESMTPLTLIGGALALGGVLVATVRRQPTPAVVAGS